MSPLNPQLPQKAETFFRNSGQRLKGPTNQSKETDSATVHSVFLPTDTKGEGSVHRLVGGLVLGLVFKLQFLPVFMRL